MLIKIKILDNETNYNSDGSSYWGPRKEPREGVINVEEDDTTVVPIFIGTSENDKCGWIKLMKVKDDEIDNYEQVELVHCPHVKDAGWDAY